jgi:hypothetical protein
VVHTAAYTPLLPLPLSSVCLCLGWYPSTHTYDVQFVPDNADNADNGDDDDDDDDAHAALVFAASRCWMCDGIPTHGSGLQRAIVAAAAAMADDVFQFPSKHKTEPEGV